MQYDWQSMVQGGDDLSLSNGWSERGFRVGECLNS